VNIKDKSFAVLINDHGKFVIRDDLETVCNTLLSVNKFTNITLTIYYLENDKIVNQFSFNEALRILKLNQL
jgi:helix-turn-helix protein